MVVPSGRTVCRAPCCSLERASPPPPASGGPSVWSGRSVGSAGQLGAAVCVCVWCLCGMCGVCGVCVWCVCRRFLYVWIMHTSLLDQFLTVVLVTMRVLMTSCKSLGVSMTSQSGVRRDRGGGARGVVSRHCLSTPTASLCSPCDISSLNKADDVCVRVCLWGCVWTTHKD